MKIIQGKANTYLRGIPAEIVEEVRSLVMARKQAGDKTSRNRVMLELIQRGLVSVREEATRPRGKPIPKGIVEINTEEMYGF